MDTTRYHRKDNKAETSAKPYLGKMTPFKIAGNVYFVGTYQGSVHLIDTGEGFILIDTGYRNTLYLLIESIWELGFNPKDIKYLVHTHWHGDHTEGTEALVDLTGAKTIIGVYDKDYVIERGYFTPDITVEDGDTLTLGNTTLEFMHTPGHTKGTMSIFFDTVHEGKTYRVGMFGGAGANSLVKTVATSYEGCREDYINSIHRLEKEHVDVFIGNHCWNNLTRDKGKLILKGGENLFIDENEWQGFLVYCKIRYENLPKE